jgi:hypothetical protein
LKTFGAPDENVSQRREQAEWVYDSCRFREQKEIPVKLETAVPKAHDPKGRRPQWLYVIASRAAGQKIPANNPV